MNIINCYPKTMTKREQYLLTSSPAAQKMQNAKGTVLEVAAWAVYEDVDEKGMSKEVLSIMTKDGEIFGTISPTFKEDFARICDFFAGEEFPPITVIEGTSKNGRNFITCTIV